jgi:hypothetical protein
MASMLKPPLQEVRGTSCRVGCEMLVPRFSISQDEKEVQVQIRVPFVRVGESEVHVVSWNRTGWSWPSMCVHIQ